MDEWRCSGLQQDTHTFAGDRKSLKQGKGEDLKGEGDGLYGSVILTGSEVDDPDYSPAEIASARQFWQEDSRANIGQSQAS